MVVENVLIIRNLNNTEMKYTYSMTKSSYNGVQAYGIKAQRDDIEDGKVVRVEVDEVKLISPQRHKVKMLLNLLYKNEVSPIHLIDIIGEYVDKWVCDFDIKDEMIISIE